VSSDSTRGAQPTLYVYLTVLSTGKGWDVTAIAFSGSVEDPPGDFCAAVGPEVPRPKAVAIHRAAVDAKKHCFAPASAPASGAAPGQSRTPNQIFERQAELSCQVLSA
jgi:hypothetical protein